MNTDSVALIYFSPTRTTRIIVEAIARGFQSEHIISCDLTLPPSKVRMFDKLGSELAIIGVPVYSGRVPEDAIDRFRENISEIRLLLFDVVMPKKNGKEAYEEICRIKDNVPVLYSSGYTADIIHRKGILDPSVNFISKPVTPQELLSKIRETLSSKKS